MNEKFQIGDTVSFDFGNKKLIGTGEVLGKAFDGLAPAWIVLIQQRNTTFCKGIPEKALIVLESFMKKINKKKNTAKIKELENDIKDAEDDIEDCNDVISNSEGEIEELENDIEKYRDEIEELENGKVN